MGAAAHTHLTQAMTQTGDLREQRPETPYAHAMTPTDRLSEGAVAKGTVETGHDTHKPAV